MSYEKVAQAENIKIGTKQTVKALESGKAIEVFVAQDADPYLINEIRKTAKKYHVTITNVDSMKKLGKASKIDVGAAVVAIVSK
ncbi:large subunit ribosomal protein L7A [Oikeobacillus pervagus]|uniref:Large subunit ribosomal protein L7A n=1 Tax=Oikeobacillus pervagus TaxID=1325931 RepID=A0AAJ1SZF2_9BACI|nr:50S ribosomal protein L7ae-like protein [Oikeobacillus pervagus]MDQ0215704.1 large subunit ribosomal protein L7A [Oikeobacillus pervagus]